MHQRTDSDKTKTQQPQAAAEQQDMMSLAAIPSQIGTRIGQVLGWTSATLSATTTTTSSVQSSKTNVGNDNQLLSYSNRGGSPTYTDDHDLARGIKRKISISTPPMALKSQHAAKVRLHPLYEESVELIASKCS